MGPLVGLAEDFFREPAFVSNSAVKVTLIALTCMYAAGDSAAAARWCWSSSRRTGARLAVGLMLLFADTSPRVLWAAMAFDGLIALGLTAFVLLAHLARHEPDTAALTAVERRVRALLIAFTVLFVIGAVAYEAGPMLGTRPLPRAAVRHQLGGEGDAARDAVRLRGGGAAAELSLVGPIIAVHVLSVFVSGFYLVPLDTDATLPLFGADVRMTDVLWGASRSTARSRSCSSCSRAARGTLAIGPRSSRRCSSARWSRSATCSSRGTRSASRRRRSRATSTAPRRDARPAPVALPGGAGAMQLRPLLELLPPLSEIEPDARRRFLERRFKTPPPWPPLLKHLTQFMIRICQQLSFVGYYGDRRSFESIGYQPFSERARVADLAGPTGPAPADGRPARGPRRQGDRDRHLHHRQRRRRAILAYELAKQHPDREILVLERGRYVEPRHFTEDEVGMIVQLYADGMMQQTEDFRFTVLQGSCVGGSTTVNNAVCFDPPAGGARALERRSSTPGWTCTRCARA